MSGCAAPTGSPLAHLFASNEDIPVPLSPVFRLFPSTFLRPMPLTREQQQAVANHLKSRAQPPKCQVCGAANMVVQEHLTHPNAADPESTADPLVNVVCNYCGHVLHFSTSVLGLAVD